MRLRSIMTIIFCITAIAPLAIFWLWPHSDVLDKEIREVRERHLVIAENIAATLDRYETDITSVFRFLKLDIPKHSDISHYSELFKNMNINHICIANFNSGVVLRSIHSGNMNCPQQVPAERLEWMKQQMGSSLEKVTMTGVMPSKDGVNVFYVLQKINEKLYIGAFSTQFLKDLGSKVSFGDKGHAVITDKAGKVVSHPNQEWEEARKDLSDLHMIKMLKSGQKGVTSFFSSSQKERMIAGYVPTQSNTWNVFVPQPLSELQSKADSIKLTALTVMGIGLVLAIILAYFATKILTNPIEQMVEAMKSIGNGELWAHEKINVGKLQAKEFTDARESIKTMAEKLQENIDTISRHAYLDGITGLPNRECFRVLAKEEIDKLSISGNSGALLFLDLDGFKQVNDVYGHRAGDDLLLAFSKRLHEHCGQFMKRYARGVNNALTVLPARLGGDEFVVFLGNIAGPETTSEFASLLFSKVFGKFNLHNGVTLDISGSVGGAIFPTQAGDFDELLRLADIAMYEAKNSGKGRYCLHKDVDDYFENLSPSSAYEEA